MDDKYVLGESLSNTDDDDRIYVDDANNDSKCYTEEPEEEPVKPPEPYVSRSPILMQVNRRIKPKRNYKDPEIDKCQTPPYALWPLMKYIPAGLTVYEPCAGMGYMQKTIERTNECVYSDILYEDGIDYLEDDFPEKYDIMITNPPYSKKYQFFKRAFSLGKPFAMLVPIETHGSGQIQELFKLYKPQFIHLNRRVDFGMPNKGFEGTAQFPVMWVCYSLNLPEQIVFGKIENHWKKTWKVFVQTVLPLDFYLDMSHN